MKKQPKSIRKRTKRSIPPKDLTGKRFGKWVVQKYAGEKGGARFWFCRCDCGVQKNVYEFSLINKRSTQCLCCSWAKRSMGHTKSYFAWQRLKQNGLLPKQWQDYNDFQEAVGDPPSNDARLARHDIYKPHVIGNTYWANPKSPSFSRQKLKQSKEKIILGSEMLMNIRKAKTREEMIRCMVTARKAGYKYEMIGLAAGLSRQRAHQIIKKHMGK
ncbi:MAG: hypothetical protein ABSG67_22635 [Thermoguttaceae bacterium]|jgi:hypothetical protein